MPPSNDPRTDRMSWSRFYAPARLQVSAWVAGLLIGCVVGIAAGAGILIVVLGLLFAGLAQFGTEIVWRRRAK
jgi:hypothetical protein